MARDFKVTDKVEAELYTDPSRKTYAAIGARAGGTTVFDPRAALAATRALAAGHRQTSTAGHALQQGGELVVAPGGRLLYRHLAAYAGDHADVDEVLAALPAAPSASGAPAGDG
jgi:hypothetical protein